MRRRDFLRNTAGLAALLGAPRGLAAASSDRRFVFVFNPGGWDPTRVFAPAFGTAAAMESGAVATTIGDLPLVDHADRPSVRTFFEAHHARTAVFNGMLVPSVAHEACTRISMTGSPDDGRADWPALVASQHPGFLLPHLVVGGPSYAGPHGTSVIRTGQYGQLGQLVDGSAIRATDATLRGLSPGGSDAVDRVLARRAEERVAASRTDRERVQTEAFRASHDQLADLRALEGSLDLYGGPLLEQQADLAVDALAAGTSRCVTIAHGAWDSHTNNDGTQSLLFEDLFSGLMALLDRLATEDGPTGGKLLDDTVVVVMSEMGRTPALNDDLGKDHWPFTSAMLIGAGVAGDRVFGAFDENYDGAKVDAASGRPSPSGQSLSSAVFGATLLSLAGLDPAEHLPGVAPVTDALA